MLKRYAIWNRQDEVFTPGTDPNIKGWTYSTQAGTSRFTAQEWAQLHPAPANAVIVCAAGDYNGGFFGTLGQMVQVYTAAGADFSGAETDEEKLEVIEAFEDARNDPGDPTESTPEERTAAALEALVMNGMETVNDISDLDE